MINQAQSHYMTALSAAATQAERIQVMAEHLVKLATQDGYIITIEQRPLHPLAMGHHETVVEVREKRELAS